MAFTDQASRMVGEVVLSRGTDLRRRQPTLHVVAVLPLLLLVPTLAGRISIFSVATDHPAKEEPPPLLSGHGVARGEVPQPDLWNLLAGALALGLWRGRRRRRRRGNFGTCRHVSMDVLLLDGCGRSTLPANRCDLLLLRNSSSKQDEKIRRHIMCDNCGQGGNPKSEDYPPTVI